MPGRPGLPARQAARVVVRDPDGRVLLLRYDDPAPMGVHWATPGGGLEPGESPREAAARELREETGWAGTALGAQLGTSTRVVVRREGSFRQHETHFAAAVPVPEQQLSAAGHAVDEITAWAWLTPQQIAALVEPVWPRELLSWLSPPDP